MNIPTFVNTTSMFKDISKLYRYLTNADKKEQLDRIRTVTQEDPTSNYYLQDNLYKLGMFKDRTGRNIDYRRAVDGIIGPMTRVAMERAKAYGYDIDERTGNVTQYGGNGWYLGDSSNEGLRALIDHNVKYNINRPNVVIDKKNGLLHVLKRDKIVYSAPITRSQNLGDYSRELGAKTLDQMSRTTGAGIYTAHPAKNDKLINNGPLFYLRDNSGPQGFNIAIHEPLNTPQRLAPFKNNYASNRVSYGCVSLSPGIVKHLYDNKYIREGDSVYVLPEMPGNKLVEKEGVMQMSWGKNNPRYYTDSRGRKRKAHYNNNR